MLRATRAGARKTSSRADARLESVELRRLLALRHVEGHARPHHEAGVVGREFGAGTLVVSLGIRDLGDAVSGASGDGEARAHRPLTHAKEVEANGAPAEVDIGRPRTLDLSS